MSSYYLQSPPIILRYLKSEFVKKNIYHTLGSILGFSQSITNMHIWVPYKFGNFYLTSLPDVHGPNLIFCQFFVNFWESLQSQEYTENIFKIFVIIRMKTLRIWMNSERIQNQHTYFFVRSYSLRKISLKAINEFIYKSKLTNVSPIRGNSPNRIFIIKTV